MSVEALKIELDGDFAQFKAWLDETSSFLLADRDRPRKARERFAGKLVRLIENGRGVELKVLPATGAGEIRVAVLPSNELLGLVAAFRAGD